MTTSIEIGGPNWQDAHRDRYLRTNGTEGHFVDFSRAGGPKETPCLLLKTRGRRSGEARVLPLIYGKDGDRFVIVASKGGALKHPAWFLNLEAKPQVEFQVGDKKYRGIARSSQGPERERLFAMMTAIFPPYATYQTRTDR